MPKITSRSNATLKSAAFHDRTPNASKIIAKVFNECLAECQRDIRQMLKDFAYREGMTVAQARTFLNAPIDAKTTAALIKKAQALGDDALLRQVEREAFKLTYSRKKAMEAMLQINYRSAAKKMTGKLTPIANELTKEAYGRTMYEVQRSTHVGFEIGGVSERVMNKALSKISYTQTTYMTARSLGDPLHEKLLKGILKGDNPDKIGMEISKVSDVVPWKAKGIVRTAVTEITNDAEIETLKESGIRKYRYLATLDETTCPICGGIDGQTFNVDDKKTGVNCPPMHPNCRCTTTPAFTETALSKAMRSAKDGKKWVKVPSGMTYSQWKSKFMP